MTNDGVIRRLAESYMMVARQHYIINGVSRANLYAILQAQALSLASIIVGTNGEAKPFFDKALEQAIEQITKIKEDVANAKTGQVERKANQNAGSVRGRKHGGISQRRGVHRAKHKLKRPAHDIH